MTPYQIKLQNHETFILLANSTSEAIDKAYSIISESAFIRYAGPAKGFSNTDGGKQIGKLNTGLECHINDPIYAIKNGKIIYSDISQIAIDKTKLKDYERPRFEHDAKAYIHELSENAPERLGELVA